MTSTREDLVRELRRAGFSKSAIDAAWPAWWNEEAESSSSARAELRFALSRRLGLAPRPLLGERVEFFWDDSARFKHLRIHEDYERGTIASFGIALGLTLIQATPEPPPGSEWKSTTALELRRLLLTGRQFVDLQALVTCCWSFGIPVIHVNVVPLETKSMHAMVVQHGGRFAILLARRSRFPAQVAFTIAHELGHILLNHLGNARAIVDLSDPAESHDEDKEEQEADEFALSLLTGTTDPIIETNHTNFNAPTLADAAIRASQAYGVDPGTIALTLAYTDGSWARTMSALKFIYGNGIDVPDEINKLANQMLNWDNLTDEAGEYLAQVMAGPDA